jgi:hypothetical protein
LSVSPQPALSGDAKACHGRKYFSEEERLQAKRRRDAEYRERVRRKLEAAAGPDPYEAAPVESGSPNNAAATACRSQRSTTDFDGLTGHPGGKNLLIDDATKIGGYAEHQERLKITKLLQLRGLEFLATSVQAADHGYPEIFVQAYDPSCHEQESILGISISAENLTNIYLP